MKKQIIVLILLLSIVSCSQDSSVSENSEISETSIATEEEVPEIIEEEDVVEDKEKISDFEETKIIFDEKKITSSNDKIVLNIGVEILDKGKIARKLEYTKKDENYSEVLVLEFDGVESYELIETIPKSFVKSAKDLNFSIEPEIIEDDPVVKWFIDRQISRIEITAKDRVISAAGIAGLQAWVTGKDKKQAALDAGGDEAIMVLFDSIDDIEFLNNMRKCDKYDGLGQQSCIFQLIQKYPTKFTTDDCKGLSGFFSIQESWTKACNAIITDDIGKCVHFDNPDSGDKFWQICRDYFIDFKTDKCKDEQCIYDICTDSFDSNCCKKVKDSTLNNKCLSQTTMNYIYCLDIKDKTQSKKCCDEMLTDKEKCVSELEENEEVIDLEVIAEEKESSDDFRSRSSHCPYPVSNDAVWVEKGYADSWAEGYQENGKWVGLVTKYQTQEKDVLKEKICYKTGLKHGTLEQFNKLGQRYVKNDYIDGQGNGDWFTYSPENGQVLSKSSMDEKGYQGDFREYYPDGSIKTEGQSLNHTHIGKWNFYNPDGSLSMQQEYDSNGKQTFYKKY